ncbi:methyltransferase [Virgibacillus halodenitrificans]|uniref:Methyltransferase n=1 Tax=Virgibacillus halodenitrificans TaxID=1482 RepID=A0AAC9IZP4_VIRHA|nr:DUF1259 domain-containing protein [Virgibacillus halodenitrificans]APC48105.1 methyltransferase [Virgibacillus halodenitrificans]MEC2159933.1 DUF1259 domain-containing protein [Virgibacillus halodenitrificans]
MENFQYICQQYAQIVNGKPKIKDGACTADIGRNLNVTVFGRTSKSILTAEITFESMEANGNALNLAEVAVLQEELPLFVDNLAKNNLTVSAIHNHWIFTNPSVLYVHAQSIEHPITFAQKFANAFSVLKEK